MDDLLSACSRSACDLAVHMVRIAKPSDSRLRTVCSLVWGCVELHRRVPSLPRVRGAADEARLTFATARKAQLAAGLLLIRPVYLAQGPQLTAGA
jgi:hypothetical protein